MKFISKKCAGLTPYVCGEQPQDKKYIKLNTNENPYPPSPRVKEFLRTVDETSLRLYPDPENKELRLAISKLHNTDIDNIFVGNGSDEILSFIFPAYFNEGGTGVATADVTYSFYPVYCDYYNTPLVKVPLREDFTLNLADYDSLDVEGFIICNPNAPTGITVKKETIIDFVQRHPDKLIVVDEAYVDFCNESVIDYVEQFDNLLVVRTFSKSYSLAGIRCGYCVGNSQLINALNVIKNSFNSYTVNRLTEKIATIAVEDRDYFDAGIKLVVEARELLTSKMTKLGFNVLPSGSNFLFLSIDKIHGEKLYLGLKDKGFLVRYFKKPRIDNFVRITMGSLEDTNKLLVAVNELLGK